MIELSRRSWHAAVHASCKLSEPIGGGGGLDWPLKIL